MSNMIHYGLLNSSLIKKRRKNKMIVDLIIGIIGLIAGINFGYGLNSIFIFLFAFFLDGDIALNEFLRIFVFKEKRFKISTLLDEYSYTHKYLLHLPLLVIPIVYILGLWYLDSLFGVLIVAMVLLHLIHDTVDSNFDGVCWLFPFYGHSYKIRNGHLEIKTRQQLRKEAVELAKKPRDTKAILKSNICISFLFANIWQLDYIAVHNIYNSSIAIAIGYGIVVFLFFSSVFLFEIKRQ